MTEELYQMLLSQAERDRRSVSYLIREAITEYLTRVPGSERILDPSSGLASLRDPEHERKQVEAARLAMQEAGELTPLEVVKDHYDTAHNGRSSPDCDTCSSFRL